jgi:hypothetical protein
MKESLDELAQYVRQNIPQSRAISHLTTNEEAEVVTFRWHGREFLVKKSFEVLELRGKRVYITGASTLLQVVLMKRNSNEKIVEGLISALQEAEDLVASRHRVEAGMKLLQLVKGNLTKLAGRHVGRAAAANRPPDKVAP